MQVLKYVTAILVPAIQLRAIATLLPPTSMHPIQPANLNWHLKVFTPPDEYLVHLKPGYTLSQHFETIGKDLTPHFRRCWDDFEIFESAHYIVYLPDTTDLDLIRRDAGVESVERSAE